MIKYFKWKNLYSFKNEGKISFEVNQNAPQTNEFTDHNEVKLSKIEGVFGANASGKTNVLKALSFIQNFVTNSFHFKEKGFYNYSSYMMNNEGSEFEIGFFIDEVYYIYSFSVNIETVLSEKLQKKDPHLKVVFERNRQKFNGVNFENKNIQSLFDQMVRPNASVISTFAQINQLEMQKIINFWTNNVIFPWYPNTQDIAGIEYITKGYEQSPDLLSELQNILGNLDIGEHTLSFGYFNILDSMKKERPCLSPMITRYNSKTGEEFKLYLASESHGVFSLFSKLFFILKAIREGALIAIDELEFGIHPQAVSRILHLFTEKSNKKGQILFITHMTPVLIGLNKYQVHLVEKSKDNESEVFRLDQVRGVRVEDNLFKNYMSGKYGGFPDIDF